MDDLDGLDDATAAKAFRRLVRTCGSAPTRRTSI